MVASQSSIPCDLSIKPPLDYEFDVEFTLDPKRDRALLYPITHYRIIKLVERNFTLYLILHK
jgi:hypothetical protein